MLMQSNCIKREACTHNVPVSHGGVALDYTGTFVGSLCAIHCVLCAIAPGFLALAGISILHSHEAEWLLAALAVGIGSTAAMVGYRVHRSGRIVLRFAMSCALLVAARVIEECELHTLATALAVLASILLVSTHLANRSVTHAPKLSAATDV